MPTLPVIPHIFRCTIDFDRVNGIEPHNVFHVACPTGTVNDVGAALESAFLNGCIHALPNTRHILSWTVLPLDGISAGVTFPSTFGFAGSGTGEDSPSSAYVMTFRTGVRGARGRGRNFIGPVSEDQMANGEVDSTTATTMISAWADFQINLQGFTPAMDLVVASYTHADANPVTHIDCDTPLGTQRRRQDQLR